MTALAQVTAGAGAATVVNENNQAMSPAGLYGRRAPATTGLTWGYYGGIFQASTVADGTVALTASNTNYVVAALVGGAVSASTATTNWNDSANYLRLYAIVAGASTITSFVDHREAYGPSGGGGGGVASVVAGSGITVDNTDPINPIVAVSGGGGALAPVVTESGTSLLAVDADAGNYTRFTNASAKTYSFDSGETYTLAAEFHGRNVGAGDLTLTAVGGFVLNAPAGGTLIIPQGGTFTVKIVDTAEADVFGVTT